jgi:hypothetical protein
MANPVLITNAPHPNPKGEGATSERFPQRSLSNWERDRVRGEALLNALRAESIEHITDGMMDPSAGSYKDQ